MVKVLKRFTLNLMFAPTWVREEPNNCSDINFNFTVILVVVSSHFFKNIPISSFIVYSFHNHFVYFNS